MIYLQPLPLPEAQVKAVRTWLTDPAFEMFVGWLANRAAMLTAEAGNLMVEGDSEAAPMEAVLKAAEARKFKGAWEIMTKFADRSYTPEHAQLLPKPVTTKET